DLERAQALYQRALEARERVLGSDHPSTLASLTNLAAVLQDQGDLERAQALYQRALEARERVLGPDHPSTSTTRHQLASLLNAQGRVESAQQISAGRSRSEEIRVAVLGENARPDLESLQEWLNSDPHLRAVRIATPHPEPGSMGAVANAISVVIPALEVTSPFVAALVTWLRTRRGRNIRVSLTSSNGVGLQLSADKLGQLSNEKAEDLTATLSVALRQDV
ncbi:tetratricopeptide repeat protein, partial [Streptomyces sp. NPDC006314]|uniref:effector-associated constant component EACC1 n=1 Tax=Streptomyces sp. NPDC006314 TaxID=3154475 RepID=UPI0033BACC5E